MQRWGLYIYVAMFVVGTVVGLMAGIPFTIVGVLVPLVVIAVGITYWKKMQ